MVLPDAKSTFWVLVNKPRSVLTTMEDDKDRETLLDIVPKVSGSFFLIVNTYSFALLSQMTY